MNCSNLRVNSEHFNERSSEIDHVYLIEECLWREYIDEHIKAMLSWPCCVCSDPFVSITMRKMMLFHEDHLRVLEELFWSVSVR